MSDLDKVRIAQKLELIARDCDAVTNDKIFASHAEAIRGVIREIDAQPGERRSLTKEEEDLMHKALLASSTPVADI